jgi:hypothetical protein
MAFMMKKFAQALRRSPSRRTDRGIVSCEMLESRQLMSAGIQAPQAVGETAMPMLGGGQSPWIDTGPTLESTGAQEQFVSKLGSGGLGTYLYGGPGGAPTEITSGGSADSTVASPSTSTGSGSLDAVYGAGPQLFVSQTGNSATATTSSIGALPGGVQIPTGATQNAVVAYSSAAPTTGSTATGSSVNALPGGPETIAIGAPIQVMSGGAGATLTSTPVSNSAGNADVAYSGGKYLFVSRAGNGATSTGSGTGARSGGVGGSASGAQGAVVTRDGAGSTSAPIFVGSSALSLPTGTEGGGPAVFVNQAGSGATTYGPSTGALPVSVKVGAGGGQNPITFVNGAGSTTGSQVAAFSASQLPVGGGLATSGGPIQFVNATPTQSLAPGASLD